LVATATDAHAIMQRAEQDSRRGQRRWGFALISLVILFLLIWRVVPVGSRQVVAVHPVSAQDASRVAPSQSVDVHVRAAPSQAHVYLDDLPIENPAHRTFRNDRSEHKIRIEADGFKSREYKVTFDQNLSLDVALEEVRVAPSASRPPAQAVVPRKQPAATSSPAKPKGPDCSQPFYVDDRGIKTLRRECR
jgi:hypothetical protein